MSPTGQRHVRNSGVLWYHGSIHWRASQWRNKETERRERRSSTGQDCIYDYPGCRYQSAQSNTTWLQQRGQSRQLQRKKKKEAVITAGQIAGGWAFKSAGTIKQDFLKVGGKRQWQKNDRIVVKSIADLTALIAVWLNVEVKLPKNTLSQARAWSSHVVTTLNLCLAQINSDTLRFWQGLDGKESCSTKQKESTQEAALSFNSWKATCDTRMSLPIAQVRFQLHTQLSLRKTSE